MNRRIAFLITLCFLGNGLWADEAKDIKKIIEEGPYLETSQKGIKLSGYVDAGYTYNFIGNGSTVSNRSVTTDGNARGDFNLHACKLTLEKPLSEANELQAGFRADLMIGEDAASLGQGVSGSDSLHLQQAYVQFRVPWGNGLDIHVGKFGALIGYEMPERPCNLNITGGNVSAIDPAWYTGVKFTYPISETWETCWVVSNGNLRDDGPGLDGNSDENSFSGCVKYHKGEDFCAQLGFHYSPWGDSGYATENENIIIGNIWMDWKPKFAKQKLLIAMNASIASFSDFSATAPAPADNASSFWGAALYLKYKITDWFGVANRFEYMHTDDDQFLAVGSNSSNDIWGWTGTLSFDVIENFLMRVEHRIDWGDDLVSTLGANSSGPAHTTSLEVVYSF